MQETDPSSIPFDLGELEEKDAGNGPIKHSFLQGT
jgi:hypothetical protein